MLISLFVLARILANPLSNALQKQLTRQSAHPIFIIGVVYAWLAVICFPWLLASHPLPSRDVWVNMTICASLAVAGNTLLVAALQSTDLSILAPINAYKSIVGLVLGAILIGEQPTPAGVAGVVLILAGSYFIVDRDPGRTRANAFVRFFRERGIQLRFAALVFSATEAVFLKKAILLSSPVTAFVLWCVLGLPIAAAAIVALLQRRAADNLRLLRDNPQAYVWLALTTGVMQLATALTFDRLQVGYSLALFQLSTLLSMFLGYRYFEERNIRRRLLGSLVMAAGAVLIAVFGA